MPWKWLTFFLVILGIGASVLIFKRNISEFAIVRYLNSKGIAIELEVEKISLTEIILKNIVVEERTKITSVLLQFKNDKGLRGGLTALNIEAKNIDVPEVLRVVSALSGASDPQAPKTDKVDQCKELVDVPLQVRLETLSWDKVVWPLALVVNHPRGYPEFSLQFAGATHNPQTTSAFSLESSAYKGEVHIFCRDTEVAIENVSFDLMGRVLRLADSKQIHKNIHLKMKQAEFALSKTEQVRMSVPLSLEWQAEDEKKSKIHLSLPQVGVAGNVSLLGSLPFDVSVSAKKLKMEQPQNLAVSRLKFDVQAKDFKKLYSGTLALQGLDYKKIAVQAGKRVSTTLFAGLNMEGEFRATPGEYQSTLRLNDRAGGIQSPELALFARPEQSVYEVHWSRPTKFILNEGLRETLPVLQPIIHGSKGELLLSGQLSSVKGILAGELKIDGDKIDLDTEYGKFAGISWHHNIISIPSMESSAGQKLNVDFIDVGPGISDLSAVYKLESLDLLNVQSLKLKFEEAEIETDPFTARINEKRLENFNAKISHMSLQKVLAIGLKNMITAQGTLSGILQIKFKEKIPAIHGKLTADQPGWIQYRPGTVPAKNIRLTDGPMDILNAYLYDFHYENLSIDITTDDSYKVIMTLSAYGRNPNYLGGKPLKLKINLEQNLLAAFQSLMLTYDLPNKIKERFENVENP